MKTTKVYVEAKKSKNFQTYTVGLECDVSDEQLTVEKIRELQAKCRRLCQEQIKIDEDVK